MTSALFGALRRPRALVLYDCVALVRWASTAQLSRRAPIVPERRVKEVKALPKVQPGRSTATSQTRLFELMRRRAFWTSKEMHDLKTEGKTNEVFSKFEHMLENGITPYTIHFNIAIAAAAKADSLDRAIRYFKQMTKHHVSRDTVTFGTLFGACARSSDRSLALATVAKLRAKLKTLRIRLDALEYGALVWAYARHQEFDAALAVIDEMVAVRVRPSLFSLNVLLAAYCRTGRLDDAFALYRKMKPQYRVKPDVFTYRALFAALANASGESSDVLEKVAQLRADVRMRRRQLLDTTAYNTLLTACGRHGDVNAVTGIFKEMSRARVPPDVVTFNIIISAIGRSGGGLPEAIGFYKKMKEHGVVPDRITFASLLDACANSSNSTLARSNMAAFRAELKRQNIGLDIVHYNTLLKAFANHAEVDEALGVFAEMCATGIEPDAITFNTLIGALGRAGRLNDVIDLHQKMTSRDDIPKEQLHVAAVFDACANSPNRSFALARIAELREELKSKEIKLNDVAFNALIKAYAMHADLDAALAAYAEMRAAGIAPSDQTFSVILAAIGHLGNLREAWRVLALADEAGVPLSTYVVSALFNCAAYSRSGDEGLARIHELRERARREGLTLSPEAYYTLIKAIGACTSHTRRPLDMSVLYAIFDEMEAAGVRPIEKCFRALLSAVKFDRRNGFAEAILAARFIARRGQALTSHMFSYLLRICEKCDVYDVPEAERKLGIEPTMQNEESSIISSSFFRSWQGTVCASLDDYILSPRFRATENFPLLVVATRTSTDRFALIGGVDGILRQLALVEEQPAIELFAHFFHFVPNTFAADELLLRRVDAAGLTPSGPFVVHLVGRRLERSYPRRPPNVAHFFEEFTARRIEPDVEAMNAIATYCTTSAQARDLLDAIDARSIAPDVELFERLVDCALFKARDLAYAEEIIGEMTAMGVRPSENLLYIVDAGRFYLSHVAHANDSRKAGEDARVTAAKLREFDAVFDEFKRENGVDVGRTFFVPPVPK